MADLVERIVRIPEAEERTGQTRSTINELEKLGLFPQRRLIGRRKVGWLESEIVAYLRGLPTGIQSGKPRLRRDADGNLVENNGGSPSQAA